MVIDRSGRLAPIYGCVQRRRQVRFLEMQSLACDLVQDTLDGVFRTVARCSLQCLAVARPGRKQVLLLRQFISYFLLVVGNGFLALKVAAKILHSGSGECLVLFVLPVMLGTLRLWLFLRVVALILLVIARLFAVLLLILGRLARLVLVFLHFIVKFTFVTAG